RLQRSLARNVGGLHLLACHDFRLTNLPVSVGALGALGCQRDHALLIGDLDRLLLVDIENFAGPGGVDALAFKRELHIDALPLDCVASLQFGRLYCFCPCDLERARLTLGADALGGNNLLLRDPCGLDRLARGDVGFLGRAIAGDFERADAFFLRDAGCFSCLARSNTGDFQRLVAINLELAGCLLGGDAVGREVPLAGDTGGFHSLLGLDLGLLHIAHLKDLHRPRALVGGDALDIDGHGLGDAGLFGGLARRDLGFLYGAGALDLAPSGLLFIGNACVGDSAILLNAGLLDRLARGDFGLLYRPRTFDVALTHLLLGRDPGGIDSALVGDPGLLDLLAGEQFLFLHRAGTFDLTLAGFALGCDPGLGDGELVGDARFFDSLARRELRLFGFGLAQRPFACHFRALQRAAHLDIALLFEAGGFALALDLKSLPLGIEVAGTDLDHRVLFDIVAQLALGLDVLHQPGQTFGVESVRRIEIFEIGLVEVGNG